MQHVPTDLYGCIIVIKYVAYKSSQQDEVDRRLTPLDVKGDQQGEAGDEGHHEQPGVVVDKLLDGGREHEDGSHDCREGELHAQETVDLAEEAC